MKMIYGNHVAIEWKKSLIQASWPGVSKWRVQEFCMECLLEKWDENWGENVYRQLYESAPPYPPSNRPVNNQEQ